jgi:hypothetical protein
MIQKRQVNEALALDLPTELRPASDSGKPQSERDVCYTKARSGEVRMWGSEFTYTHITSLLAPPVLRLARVNLPVGTFEFANSIRPFSSTRPATWLQCNV